MLAAVLGLGIAAAHSIHAQDSAKAEPGAEETPMTESAPDSATPDRTEATAEGTFEVSLVPLTVENADEGSGLGRMSLEKTFHGDLEGTSHGQMLTAGNPATGSAGYVAVEKVTGTLGGRSGSFALQHNGTMDQGELGLTITVVPGSASGELAGLEGSMSIEIEDGQHSYRFEYSLPAAP